MDEIITHHTYFVSYSFVRDGALGFGNLTYTFADYITNLERIKRLEERIAKDRSCEGVCILYFQLLEPD